jgi:hypothetical protein
MAQEKRVTEDGNSRVTEDSQIRVIEASTSEGGGPVSLAPRVAGSRGGLIG